MDSQPTDALFFGARSDIGPRRRDNQDAGYGGDDLLLIVDGVGGNPAGDLASALIVRTLAELLRPRTDSSESTLRDQVALANARLARTGRKHPILKGWPPRSPVWCWYQVVPTCCTSVIRVPTVATASWSR